MLLLFMNSTREDTDARASLEDPFEMLSIDRTCAELESYSRTLSSRYLNEKSLITPSSVVMTKL